MSSESTGNSAIKSPSTVHVANDDFNVVTTVAHSQRACTECQHHKIKCVIDGSGPCARCKRKGFVCQIAPRKKRVSKKQASRIQSSGIGRQDGSSSSSSLSSRGFWLKRASPARARNAGMIVDNKQIQSIANCPGGHHDAVEDEAEGQAVGSTRSSESVSQAEGDTASNWMGSSSSSTTTPTATSTTTTTTAAGTSMVQLIPENLVQSTLSSCEPYSVYLSLSLTCPDLFRRFAHIDWKQQPSTVIPPSINLPTPLCRTLVESETSPVYALFFVNDAQQVSRLHTPPEALPQIQEWRKLYGDILIPVYFNFVNPCQPLVYRRNFMTAYRQGKESPALLLAIFASAVTHSNIGTSEERKTLQLKFIRHLTCYFSFMLNFPTIDAIQVYSILADCSTDRGIVTSHATAVAVAIELRFHVDCSNWNIPRWERSLRKAIWWSLCVRDSWMMVRFFSTPKVPAESYDMAMPTIAEIAELIIAEDEVGLDLNIRPIVNGVSANVTMKSCVRAFVSVASLSEVLRDAHMSLYAFKTGKLIEQSSLPAVSLVIEMLNGRLEKIMASWVHDEEEKQDHDKMEPDMYRQIFCEFINFSIYSQFLPLRNFNIPCHGMIIEFYCRLLESMRRTLDALNHIKKIKFSNYWPPWINQVLVIQLLILSNLDFTPVAKPAQTLNQLDSAYDNKAQSNFIDGNQNRVHQQFDNSYNSLLPEVNLQNQHQVRGNHTKEFEPANFDDTFLANVLKCSKELTRTMVEISASWDYLRDTCKMILISTVTFGLADMIDIPSITRAMGSSSHQDMTAEDHGSQKPAMSLQSQPQQQQRGQFSVLDQPVLSQAFAQQKNESLSNNMMQNSTISFSQSQPHSYAINQLLNHVPDSQPSLNSGQATAGYNYATGNGSSSQQLADCVDGVDAPSQLRFFPDNNNNSNDNNNNNSNNNSSIVINENGGNVTVQDFFNSLSVNLFDGFTDFQGDLIF
ncbi:fungal-specific transcription factor domain-containing protein [Lipomyces japonicus]|uniref:fungal-specific transcription factor domain-containing protein n=1 Tax=Lipomyces japonicus TaxID=56871 RepID=UPI0034CE5246